MINLILGAVILTLIAVAALSVKFFSKKQVNMPELATNSSGGDCGCGGCGCGGGGGQK